MTEPNWWDDRTMPNDDGPDWERDADGVLWQIDPRTGVRRMAASATPERQTWERPVVPGTDPRRDPVAARLLLEVDDEGRARVHEAVLAQLLVDAGWERTA